MISRILALLPIIMGSAVLAQTSVQTAGDPLLLSGSAMDLPSLQGQGFTNWSIMLPTIHGTVNNSVMNPKELRGIFLDNDQSQTTVDKIVAGSEGDVFHLEIDGHVQALGVSLNLMGADSLPWLSIGLEHRERQLTSMRLDQELIELAYYGNKDFAGRTVILDPIMLRSLTFRSLGGQVAANLKVPNSSWRAMPAVGLYHITALQALQYNGDAISMYTSPDGRYVDVTSNYRLDVATPDDVNALFRGIGRGIAVDASIGMVWKDRLQLHIGLNDMGSVKLKEGVRNYSKGGYTRYEGVVAALSDEYGTPEFQWDSLLTIFSPDSSANPFDMQLPTSLQFYGQWAFGQHLWNGRTFPRHLVWAHIRHALNEQRFTHAATGASLGYTYVAGDRFNGGASFTLPGEGDLWVGLHATVRMGSFRLGISSTDLIWLLAPANALGADARLTMQLGF